MSQLRLSNPVIEMNVIFGGSLIRTMMMERTVIAIKIARVLKVRGNFLMVSSRFQEEMKKISMVAMIGMRS